VPSAIKHDLELSDKGLVSVLLHSQAATEDQLRAFMLTRFPTNECFVSTGASAPTPEHRGIPHASLIGVDGKLLWDGHPLGETKKIQELIDGELAKVKKGWGATAEHKKVRAALYGKDDLGSAAALVAAMPDGDAKTELQAEVDRSFALRKRMVTELQGEGRWAKAQEHAKALLKSVGTRAEWVAEVQPMLAEFDSEDGKAELAADKKLAGIEKQLRDKKREPAQKALESLVKSAGQTKVGTRAQRILTALTTK